MAKYQVKRGATSVMMRVFIQSNAVTTGAGLTGLTTASTNLQISMIRELSSTPEVYSGADFETITTCGTYAAPTASTNIRFKAIDGTNLPGWYELQFHNSANQGFGSGDASKYVNIFIFEASTTALNLAPLSIEVELVAVDNQDAVRGGMTALPNANAEAAGGLFTRGTGAGQINQTNNGEIDVNATRLSGDATAADNAEAFFDGTGYAGTNNVIPTVTTVTTVSGLAADSVTASALAADAANEIADALLDRSNGVETSVTPRGALRAMLATTTGVIADAATTTNTFKNPAGATTRVTATVDSSGNRSAITLNV